ncbi:MAG: pantoate--beta-alanine ligase [Bacteroidales bacterium]|nr:pantoate--beta-alanine ligase [Bacteroidales bacterium]
MKQIQSTAGFKSEIDKHRGKTIGMVPTMGALHAGHTSLVERSVKENEVTVVSIFVNPTQFNDANDLLKYPRTMKSDLAMLSDILGPDDIVFTPEADDIYSDENIPSIDLGHLDKIMEGKHRPGHFMGVVRIVKILLDLCQPCRAYFGRKDFQQLAVIRTLVRQTGIKTEIIGCPIVREANGLAMSSRNARLSPSMRQKAGIIYHTLKKYHQQTVPFGIKELKKKVREEINSYDRFNVEYFEIVDDNELKELSSVKDIKQGISYTGCIAVHAGEVRLIDNIQFSFLFPKG